MNEKDIQALNETVAEAPAQKAEKKPSVFKKIQNKISASPYSYLAYCFIIPTIIMYLIYLAMEIHPFGDGSVLVLDLNGQYVYFFEALRKVVWGEGSLFYSFYRALGGEFMGMYDYYLASPLSFLLALFPLDRMLEGLLFMFLLKVGLCGLTFGFYLHKHTSHPNKIMSIAFSTMYALCAYAVVHQNNTMWTDALIWLPLLTLGLEALIREKKFKLYVVALAVTIIANYYIGYMVCIYAVAYFFYYYFSQPRNEINPDSNKNHFFFTFLRFGLFSLLAAAIAAFTIFTAYYSLTFGKSDFSNPSWTLTAKFDILDFFTKFLPGSYDTVRTNGLPFVYTGVLTLFAVPVYFVTKKIPAREKVGALCLLMFFFSSFIIKPLDLIWHGFSTPNWLNYRYSFIFCFFILTLAYKGFGNIRKIGEKFILGIAALLILFVAVAEKLEFESYVENDSKLLTFETVWLSVVMILFLFATIILLMRAKNPKKRENINSIVSAIICIEIFCSGLTCCVQFDGDVLYSGYEGYNTFLKEMRPVFDTLKENDPSFYRFEKVRHRKYNDNMALGIRGLSNSTSTLNSETLVFLNKLGYVSRSHLSQYRGGNPVSDSILGIKYIIDETSSEKLTKFCTPAYSAGDYTAFYNPYALSVAYGVDHSVNDFVMDDYKTHFQRLNALVSTMAGYDHTIDVYKPITQGTDFRMSNCTATTGTNSVKYEKESSSKSATITYEFIAAESADYFFHPVITKTNESTVMVNKKNLGVYLGTNSNHIMHLGYFEKGETITVTITLKDGPVTFTTGIDYFWYIDKDNFDTVFSDLLAQPQFEIGEDYTEDTLKGKIKTDEDGQMVLTTLAYDKGWKVYLDGERVETYKTLDALVAFDIDKAGEYDLVIKYLPNIYVAGIAISISGVIVFAGLCVLTYLKKRKTKINSESKINNVSNGSLIWILEDFDEDHSELEGYVEEKETPKLKKRFSLSSLFGSKSEGSGIDNSNQDNNTDMTDPMVENDQTAEDQNGGSENGGN